MSGALCNLSFCFISMQVILEFPASYCHFARGIAQVYLLYFFTFMRCDFTYLKASGPASWVKVVLLSELRFLSVVSPSGAGLCSVPLSFVEGLFVVLKVSTKVLYP